MNRYIELLDYLLDTYKEFGTFLNDPGVYTAESFCENVDESYIEVFYGSSKLVIIKEGLDYVIKIPFEEGFNYCQKELEVYNKAKEEGLGEFFAECKWFGRYCGRPIYLMKRMDTNGGEIQERFYKGYKLKCSEDYIEYDEEEAYYHYEWGSSDDYTVIISLLIDVYRKTVEQLINFLKKLGVNDLFENNIGIDRNNNIVLIDYSGF